MDDKNLLKKELEKLDTFYKNEIENNPSIDKRFAQLRDAILKYKKNTAENNSNKD